jgi:surface carbohydrate biosynthesis protein (TIGR04326 family)
MTDINIGVKDFVVLIHEREVLDFHQEVDVAISWNDSPGFQLASNQIKLIQVIEDSADEYREKYLKLVYEIGSLNINGKSVVEQLRIEHDFSFWWLTLFGLRRWNDKSGTTDTIKLLALETELKRLGANQVVFAGANRQVEKCIRGLCLKNSWTFTFHRPLTSAHHVTTQTKSAKDLVPNFLGAMFVLVRQLLSQGRIKKAAPLNQTGNAALVIDYFNGFDHAASLRGEYVSRYWHKLPSLIQSIFQTITWFHVQDVGPNSLSLIDAQKHTEHLSSRPSVAHEILETRISVKQLSRIIPSYVRLQISCFRLRGVKKNFKLSESQINFWPIFKREWNDSLRGTTAIRNLITFYGVSEKIKHLPQQKVCLYLMENQPWEMALIHAWRSYQSGKLVGIPHAAPKFWEMRRFVDPRSRIENGIGQFPQPDLVVSNSTIAKSDLLSNGVPLDNILDLEALAFQHIEPLMLNNNSKVVVSNSPPKISVLGDFNAEITDQLLSIFEHGVDSSKYQCVFKPHPMCPVNKNRLSEIGLELFTGEIAPLLAETDIMIATSQTSAAVEGFCLGIQIILFHNRNGLNMSPLKDAREVVFISSSNELRDAIATSVQHLVNSQRPYFTLDDSLGRWSAFLRSL